MGRRRKPGSKTSLGGVGLRPEEDEYVLAYLALKQVSFKAFLRTRVRDWIKERKGGKREGASY